MKLSTEDIVTGVVVLACELAWNGVAAHLDASEEVKAVLQTLSPIVNTAVIVWAICYVIYRYRMGKTKAQWEANCDGLKHRVAELEERLHKYDEAASRVQVAVDVDDYREVNEGF